MAAKKTLTTEEEPKTEAPKEERTVKEDASFLIPNLVIERGSHGQKAQRMKSKLNAQPRVTIMIPLDMGEQFGATHPVTLNGYRLNIKKGVYVEVPKQVAEVVAESKQQTQEAYDNYFKLNEMGVSRAMMDKGIYQA